jgi:hypothetical protein
MFRKPFQGISSWSTKKDLKGYDIAEYKNDINNIYGEMFEWMSVVKQSVDVDYGSVSRIAGLGGQAFGAAKKRLIAGHFFRWLEKVANDKEVTITVTVAKQLAQDLTGKKFNEYQLILQAGKKGRKATDKVNSGKMRELIYSKFSADDYISALEHFCETADKYKQATKDVYNKRMEKV